jgi:hypothetical protein
VDDGRGHARAIAHRAALQTQPLLAALGAFAAVAHVLAAGADTLEHATEGHWRVTTRDGLFIHHGRVPYSNNPLSCSRMLFDLISFARAQGRNSIEEHAMAQTK